MSFTRNWIFTIAVLLIVGDASPAHAQRARSIADMSLEELLTITITSVGRKEQALSSAPAAVFVITQDDIRRSGASSVPDLLRQVPGLQVARYSNAKWSISARGFGSYYSNKLLVLVDGRSVFTPDFSGVHWDLLDLLLEDIDRIEVIRGPGGTMWGANAVNGVINIMTKRTTATDGASATVGTGSEDRAMAAFRFGGTFGTNSGYRVYAKAADRRLGDPFGFDDTARTVRGGFRVDHGRGPEEWTIQGDIFHADERTPFGEPILAAPYLRVVADHVRASGGNVLGRWTRTTARGDRFAVQGYLDRYMRNEYIHDVKSDTVDLDFQHQTTVSGRHDLVWGTGFRQRFTTLVPERLIQYDPGLKTRRLGSAFVQDEITLGRGVTVTAGTKIEHHERVGLAVAPNARLLWSRGARHTVWGATSRSFRTPSLVDQSATLRYRVLPGSVVTGGLPVAVDVVGGARDKSLESVLAAEVGYRVRPHASLALDLTAFRNTYDHLTSYERTAPTFSMAGGVPHLLVRSYTGDQAAGHTYGFESVTRWDPTPWWTLTGSSTFLQVNLHMKDPAITAGDSLIVQLMNPRSQLAVRSSTDLPGRLELDLSVARVGPWQATGVQAYSRTDMRAAWRPRTGVTVSAGVQNLTQRRHTEASPFLWYVPAEIPRAAYVRVAIGH